MRIRRVMCAIGAGVLCLVGVATPWANAAPGNLDQTFGAQGIATAPGVDGSATDVAVGPDGTIAIAIATTYGWAVGRMTPQGAPDLSFGSSSVVTTSINGNNARPLAITVQPDGKILAAGRSYQTGDNMTVVRYNVNGTLDGTFGAGGITSISNASYPSVDQANAIALQPDGKIVLVGQADDDAVIVRLLDNGALDPAFDGDGKVLFQFPHPGYGDSWLGGVVVQDDGAIAVVGSVETTYADDVMAMARFTPSGALDPTFSGDGMTEVDFPAGSSDGNAIGIRSDGSYILGGQAGGWNGDMALARLSSDGTVDTSFAFDGTGIYAAGEDGASLQDIVVLPDDRVIGVGFPYSPGPVYVIGVGPGGLLDKGFGTKGIVEQGGFNACCERGNALAISNGDVLMAGQAYGDSGDEAVVLRYRAASPPLHPAAGIAFASNRTGNYDIYSMAPNGTAVTRLTTSKAIELQPAWSPDGTKIAFVRKVSGVYQIFTMDADGGNQQAITASKYDANLAPEWDSDGTHIYYADTSASSSYLYRMDADGSQKTAIASGGDPSWAPDDTKILFTDWSSSTPSIGSMYPDGDDWNGLLSTRGAELQPDWSPDGTRFVYTSVNGSNADLSIARAGGWGVQPLSTGKAYEWNPAWSPDGNQIAFVRGATNGEIYLIGANGIGKVNLTHHASDDRDPAWQIAP